MLPGFLEPVALDLLRKEVNAISDRAHSCSYTHNPGLNNGSPRRERDGANNRGRKTARRSGNYSGVAPDRR